jgi:hypothetical protein
MGVPGQGGRRRHFTSILRSWSSRQPSICTERTKLRCTPRPRCWPEQSRQKNVPYETDAHCGFGLPQSKHFCSRRTARVRGVSTARARASARQHVGTSAWARECMQARRCGAGCRSGTYVVALGLLQPRQYLFRVWVHRPGHGAGAVARVRVARTTNIPLTLPWSMEARSACMHVWCGTITGRGRRRRGGRGGGPWWTSPVRRGRAQSHRGLARTRAYATARPTMLPPPLRAPPTVRLAVAYGVGHSTYRRSRCTRRAQMGWRRWSAVRPARAVGESGPR